MQVRPQLLGMLSRDHLLWKVAHAEQNSMSSTGSFQTWSILQIYDKEA